MASQAERIDEAITRTLALDGEYVTRWVLTAETMDGAGERSTHVYIEPSMWDWEALGLLAYAKALQQAGLTRALLTDDDD